MQRTSYLTFVLGAEKVEERQKFQMYDAHLQMITEALCRQALLQRLPVLAFAMAVTFRKLKTTADE